ncbi:hypothetical protein INS49_004262 [Diaporthe citri]|uniref:uncharacterized protein n=1 Tax=Diaporthe citri TaxID=83186 RepID=UPI001C818D9E|nr:uncharacterized protein INS49_004262 [Diaporthe citri]KAG6355181.1 hypothetical protein INS49_004262 [Diaporthe citri]
MSQLSDNNDSRNHEERAGRPLSPNSMVRALEDLEAQLLAQQEALVSRHVGLRYNSALASQFSNRMLALREQLVDLLSDSAEAVKHARRGTSARRPGPVPGVDPGSADQRRLRIEQQRKHLRDEINELPQARDRFWHQAIGLDEQILTIRRTVAETQVESKRLKRHIEKAEKQQCRDN